MGWVGLGWAGVGGGLRCDERSAIWEGGCAVNGNQRSTNKSERTAFHFVGFMKGRG